MKKRLCDSCIHCECSKSDNPISTVVSCGITVGCLDYKSVDSAKEVNCEDFTFFDVDREENKEMINHPSHYNKGKFEAIDVFKSITDEMARLFEIKNKNYGNSFSKQFEEYGLTSVCIRLEDKLNRLKSLNKQISEAKNGIVDINVDDESIRDTLIDLANYSVLAIMEISKGE